MNELGAFTVAAEREMVRLGLETPYVVSEAVRRPASG